MSAAELKRCFECGATYPQEVLACANDGTPLCFDTVGRRWKIEGVIGRRAGGAIFAAFHLVSGQYAAIDMLPGENARQASASTRFNQQLQALRILDQNKSILRLIEEGTERDGSRFMVTELGELRPLQDLIDEWRRLQAVLMEPGEAALLVRPLLSLLSTAARLGMAHGSLDATQIFVGSANDFATGLNNVATVKLHGLAAIGMGPQLREAQAADLQGIGRVLYELCSGKLPPALDVLVKEPLPQGLEGPLGEVVLRALSAPGSVPFATAEELQRALSTAALGGRPSQSSVPSPLLDSMRSDSGLPRPPVLPSANSVPGLGNIPSGTSGPALPNIPSMNSGPGLGNIPSGTSGPALPNIPSANSGPGLGSIPLANSGPAAGTTGPRFLSLPPVPSGPRPNPPAGALPPVRVTAQHSAVPAPLASLISGPQRSGLTSELRQVSILDLMREMNEQKEKQETTAREETLARSRFRPSLNNIKPMPRPDPSGIDPGPPGLLSIHGGEPNAPTVSVLQGPPDSGATVLEPTVVDPNNAPASAASAQSATGDAPAGGTAPNRIVGQSGGTAPNRIVGQSGGTGPNRPVTPASATGANRPIVPGNGTAPNRTISQSLPPVSAAAAVGITEGAATETATSVNAAEGAAPSALSQPRNSAAQATVPSVPSSATSPPRSSPVASEAAPPPPSAVSSPAAPANVPGPPPSNLAKAPAAAVARETPNWTWGVVIVALLAIVFALAFQLLTRK